MLPDATILCLDISREYLKDPSSVQKGRQQGRRLDSGIRVLCGGQKGLAVFVVEELGSHINIPTKGDRSIAGNFALASTISTEMPVG